MRDRGVAWGATCKQHSNGPHDWVECKKQFGGIEYSDYQCRNRLKQWLFAGVLISAADPEGRETHLAEKPAEYTDLPEEVLDAQLRGIGHEP